MIILIHDLPFVFAIDPPKTNAEQSDRLFSFVWGNA